jgi:hypothetical protein
VTSFDEIWNAPDKIYFSSLSIKPPNSVHTFAREDILDAEDVSDQKELTEAVTTLRQSLHEEFMELFLTLSQTMQLQSGQMNEESHPTRGLYVGEEEDEQEDQTHGW